MVVFMYKSGRIEPNNPYTYSEIDARFDLIGDAAISVLYLAFLPGDKASAPSSASTDDCSH